MTWAPHQAHLFLETSLLVIEEEAPLLLLSPRRISPSAFVRRTPEVEGRRPILDAGEVDLRPRRKPEADQEEEVRRGTEDIRANSPRRNLGTEGSRDPGEEEEVRVVHREDRRTRRCLAVRVGRTPWSWSWTVGPKDHEEDKRGEASAALLWSHSRPDHPSKELQVEGVLRGRAPSSPDSARAWEEVEVRRDSSPEEGDRRHRLEEVDLCAVPRPGCPPIRSP